MRYNPIPGTDEDLTDYRGSIVDLTPGTTYEIQLTLTGTTTTARLTGRTWSEVFPVGRQSGWAIAEHRSRSPIPACPEPIGSMTAGERRSTYGTKRMPASRSMPLT